MAYSTPPTCAATITDIFATTIGITPDPAEHETQDVKQLKDFAASIGINREDIDLLLCYGYFVEEIEEMLYHPGEFEQALAEILDECSYDYCGEW